MSGDVSSPEMPGPAGNRPADPVIGSGMDKRKLMLPTLPPLLDLYFCACNDRYLDGACACFASDATVQDEARSHQGSAAILQWLEETTQKYAPKYAPVRTGEKDGRHLVAVTVSGNFPGSPVELEFAFTIEQSKITSLVID